jgi:CDP-diacylglycerol---glycerol-3-phosphate 3-phosphatidyltransferase
VIEPSTDVAEDAGRPRRRRSWIPNSVTFVRVALVPPILLLLVLGTQLRAAQWWAFGVFVLAALTDTVDGWAARRWQGVTAFGAFADPLADKLLIVGTLLALTVVDAVPLWVVGVIAAREVAVTALRVLVVRRAGVVVSASIWGKLKTVAQIIAVGAIILPILTGVLVDGLLLAAVLLTIGSGLDYLRRAGPLLTAPIVQVQAEERAAA